MIEVENDETASDKLYFADKIEVLRKERETYSLRKDVIFQMSVISQQQILQCGWKASSRSQKVVSTTCRLMSANLSYEMPVLNCYSCAGAKTLMETRSRSAKCFVMIRLHWRRRVYFLNGTTLSGLIWVADNRIVSRAVRPSLFLWEEEMQCE